MLKVETIREFVKEFYSKKDSMHGIDHVDRLYSTAIQLGRNENYNPDVLALAAYFHGLFPGLVETLKVFMIQLELDKPTIHLVLLATSESMTDSEPVSIEGTLLHDSHLIEGGKAYLVTKSLVTGAERGQTLPETIMYMKKNIFGKRKCVSEEAQKIYQEMEGYAKSHIEELERGLNKDILKD